MSNTNQVNIGEVNGNVNINYYDGNTGISFEDIAKAESFALESESPKITPIIERHEVNEIVDWILSDSDSDSNESQDKKDIGLVVGLPGIGKTVVLNSIYRLLSQKDNVFVLGLKSDRLLYLNNPRNPWLMKIIDKGIDNLVSQGKKAVILADQIDALSSTLSGDRNIIRNLISFLIRQGKKKNVKVVFSCRSYDLNYNPSLSEVEANSFKWIIGPIEREYVEKILIENDFKEKLNEKILDILGNPLHLYLFLQIKDSIKQTINESSYSLESLYDKLWDLKIRNSDRRKTITSFLDALCRMMYEQQSLALPECRFSEFQDEIDYLVSNGFLAKESKGNKLTFFHQTLFDYVYARRFVERGGSLHDDLKDVHQGLFVRPRVRSVMAYLRNHDEDLYIATFNDLLTKDNDCKYGCHFHILHMLLTSLAFIKDPSEDEKNIFRKYILKDPLLLSTFIKAIHSDEWLREADCNIRNGREFGIIDNCHKKVLNEALDNLISQNSDFALDLFKKYYEDASETDRMSMLDILKHNAYLIVPTKLIETIKWLQEKSPLLRVPELMDPLIGQDHILAADILVHDLRIELKSRDKSFGSFDTGNYQFKHLLEKFEKIYPDYISELWIRLLLLIASEKSIEIPSYNIRLSPYAHIIKYGPGCVHSENISEYLRRKIEEDACRHIDNGNQKGIEIVEKLFGAPYEPVFYTALRILTRTASKTYNFAYNILKDKILFDTVPGWVRYQAAELTKNILPYLSDDQKNVIIEKIMNIKDDIFLDHVKLETRLEHGITLTWQGFEKGKLLAIIPPKDLKRLNPGAFKVLNELQRKYKKLDYTPPSSINSYVGYSSLEADRKKIKGKEWVSLMKKYNSDDTTNFRTPTLTGISRDLKVEVTENPQKFITLFHKIIKDPDVPMQYCIAIFEGFVKAKKMDYADTALKKILNAVDDNINSHIRGFSLHSFLFALTDAVNNDNITDSIFSFLCKAVKEADDSNDDKNLNGTHDLINYSINKPRGNACYKLVRLIRHEEYADRIFDALDIASANESVSTRGAILVNLAATLHTDRDRTLWIFKNATHDYHPAIMNLPLHQLNPLLYLIKTNFDELRDYFEAGINDSECHKPIAQALFLAWFWTDNQKAKILLDRMIASHTETKETLMRFFNTNNTYESHSIPYIMDFINDSDPTSGLSDALDAMFSDVYDLKEYFPMIVEAYSKSNSVKQNNRSFYSSLVSYSSKDPQKCLVVIENSLGNYCDSNPDYHIWNSITDALLQSYNGIYSLHDKRLRPILEKAIDILDYLLMNSIASSRLSPFFHKLDNE